MLYLEICYEEPRTNLSLFCGSCLNSLYFLMIIISCSSSSLLLIALIHSHAPNSECGVIVGLSGLEGIFYKGKGLDNIFKMCFIDWLEKAIKYYI